MGCPHRGHLKEPGVYFCKQLHQSVDESLQTVFLFLLLKGCRRNGEGTENSHRNDPHAIETAVW